MGSYNDKNDKKLDENYMWVYKVKHLLHLHDILIFLFINMSLNCFMTKAVAFLFIVNTESNTGDDLHLVVLKLRQNYPCSK